MKLREFFEEEPEPVPGPVSGRQFFLLCLVGTLFGLVCLLTFWGLFNG